MASLKIKIVQILLASFINCTNKKPFLFTDNKYSESSVYTFHVYKYFFNALNGEAGVGIACICLVDWCCYHISLA
jgi:hypothetical protein